MHGKCECRHLVDVYPVNFSKGRLPPYNKRSGLIQGFYSFPSRENGYWIPESAMDKGLMTTVFLSQGKLAKEPSEDWTVERVFDWLFCIPGGLWKPERIVKKELWGYWKQAGTHGGTLQIEHEGPWYLEKDQLFLWEEEWVQWTVIAVVFITLLDYVRKLVLWEW